MTPTPRRRPSTPATSSPGPGRSSDRLAELGFPPEHDADYRAGLNAGVGALDDLAADPYRFIDMRHRSVLEPDEDYLGIGRLRRRGD